MTIAGSVIGTATLSNGKPFVAMAIVAVTFVVISLLSYRPGGDDGDDGGGWWDDDPPPIGPGPEEMSDSNLADLINSWSSELGRRNA